MFSKTNKKFTVTNCVLVFNCVELSKLQFVFYCLAVILTLAFSAVYIRVGISIFEYRYYRNIEIVFSDFLNIEINIDIYFNFDFQPWFI